jgi:hypothetical protein
MQSYESSYLIVSSAETTSFKLVHDGEIVQMQLWTCITQNDSEIVHIHINKLNDTPHEINSDWSNRMHKCPDFKPLCNSTWPQNTLKRSLDAAPAMIFWLLG